jgi:hypothetical protein
MTPLVKFLAPLSVVGLLVACGPREEVAAPIVFSLSQTSRSATAEMASDSAAGANADQAVSGKMIGLPMITTYVAAGDLAALDGKAASWKSDETPTKKEMRRIADALGVEGDVVEQSADMGGGFVVGSTDGSGPMMSFSNSEYDAFHSWWWSMASGGWSSDSTISRSESPVEPQKPENLPTKLEAEDAVAKIISDAGFSVDDIDVTADEWGVWATAWETFDGMRSPFAWNFGFGANKALTYASGHLLKFEKGPEFPRVGSMVGVERLSDPKYSGWYGYGATARDATMAIEPAPVGSSEPGESTDTTTSAPEVVEVKLKSVNESLMSVVDDKGVVWLLPAYEYATADGYSVSTLAIADEFIAQESPATTDTAVEPSPGDSGSEGGSEGGSDGSSDGSSPGSVGDIVAPTPEDAAALVGLTEAEAVKVIASNGWTSRVGKRDAEEFMLTADYSETRLTLTIEAEKVTAAVIG